MVLTDITRITDIWYDEILGLATLIHVVDSADEAIELANDTDYGLTGGVISEKLTEALDVATRMRTGIIHINDQASPTSRWLPSAG